MLVTKIMFKGLALSLLGLLAGQVTAAAIYPTQSTNNNTSLIEPRAEIIGLNCKGSSFCGGGHVGTFGLLTNYIDAINDDDHFNNGDRIVCSMGLICVFPQNTPHGVSGKKAKKLFKVLAEFGCDVCGSIPTGIFHGNEFLGDGELTINYVGGTDGCCGPCDGYNHKEQFPECLGPP